MVGDGSYKSARYKSRCEALESRSYKLTSIGCMGIELPSQEKGLGTKGWIRWPYIKEFQMEARKRKEKHNSYRVAVGRHPSLSIPYILEYRLLRSGGRIILLEDDVLDWPARTHVDLCVQSRASFVESWTGMDGCL